MTKIQTYYGWKIPIYFSAVWFTFHLKLVLCKLEKVEQIFRLILNEKQHIFSMQLGLYCYGNGSETGKPKFRPIFIENTVFSFIIWVLVLLKWVSWCAVSKKKLHKSYYTAWRANKRTRPRVWEVSLKFRHILHQNSLHFWNAIRSGFYWDGSEKVNKKIQTHFT